jgi:hypothetical protein
MSASKLTVAIAVVLYVFRFVAEWLAAGSSLAEFKNKIHRTSLDMCFIGLSLFAVAVGRHNPRSTFYRNYSGEVGRAIVYCLIFVVSYLLSARLSYSALRVQRRRSISRRKKLVLLSLAHGSVGALAMLMVFVGATELSR